MRYITSIKNSYIDVVLKHEEKPRHLIITGINAVGNRGLLDMIENSIANFVKIDNNNISLPTIKIEDVFKEIFETELNVNTGFNSMSSGYQSVYMMIENLLLSNIQVMVIDGIERSLHITVQKRLLPILTSYFPHIQFIITTHSPIILTSLSNCVIYDLDNKLCVEDYSNLSYGVVAEEYFNISKEKVQRAKTALIDFEKLLKQSLLTEEERQELYNIDKFFRHYGVLFSKEQFNKYLELKGKYRAI